MCDSDPIRVLGKTVDTETRCVHYHSEKDIIAIKFYCCNKYFPCYQCHNELSDHTGTVWPKTRFDEKAVLCGTCKTELSIKQYLNSNSICPSCASNFNPGCTNHHHLYFEK
jgi:uncharacterized CHY-type Zn-finger protein